MIPPVIRAWAVCLLLAAVAVAGSHPELRTAPPPSNRPLGDGPHRFVDPARGDDAAAGTKDAPWRTVNVALTEMRAGDTLVLRGGTYYEQVYCAVAGTKDKPVTIRTVVIDYATDLTLDNVTIWSGPTDCGSAGRSGCG